MTPDRLRHCLATIKQLVPMSQREMAAIIGVNERTMRRWCRPGDDGEATIPAETEAWIEKMTAFYESPRVLEFYAYCDEFFDANPPPQNTRREADVVEFYD